MVQNTDCNGRTDVIGFEVSRVLDLPFSVNISQSACGCKHGYQFGGYYWNHC
jgi:hypothetical protein